MEADSRAHADDEVADDESDDFDCVDGMGAEPEDAGHGAGKGDADEKGIVDLLPQSGPPGDDPQRGFEWYGLGQGGDSHCARSISPRSWGQSNRWGKAVRWPSLPSFTKRPLRLLITV